MTTTLLIVLLIAAAAIPVIMSLVQKNSGEAASGQYELLLTAVKDAKDYVEQIASIKEEDLSSEEKKELAVEVAKKIASNFDVPEKRQELVGDLIESVLWRDEQIEAEVDDFE